MTGKFVRILINVFSSSLTATILFFGMGANAQDQGGFYFGAGAGFVVAGETRGNGDFRTPGSGLDGLSLGTQSGTAKGQFDPSLTTSLTIGYDMNSRDFRGFRFEGELFYQKADTDQYKGLLDGAAINPLGKVNTNITGVAANAIYDIGEYGRFRPYVTLGVGQASVDTKYDFPTRGVADVNGSSLVIQGGAGLDIPYNENTTFDLKFRFRRVGTNKLGIDGDFDSYILEFGIRRTF